MKRLLVILLLLPVFADGQIITTIAGNGTPGYNGDGLPAISAEINRPNGVSFDRHNNVYIADAYNNRIRKINTSGIITTIAGGGIGVFGDGGPATNAELYSPRSVVVDKIGNFYIDDNQHDLIRKVDTFGIITTFAGGGTGVLGDGGPANSSSIK